MPAESASGQREDGPWEAITGPRGSFVQVSVRTAFALVTGVVVTPRLVLLLFLVAQAWDGVFTYTAVTVYGLAAEGNLLLATWMGIAGPGPTLLVAKTGAALGGVLLYVQGVHRALGWLTLLYGAASIAPWVVIFHTHP